MISDGGRKKKTYEEDEWQRKILREGREGKKGGK